MYPIKLNNVYFEKIWGNNYLKNFRDNILKDNIGESWDVSCHKNGESTIVNGIYKGMKLKELLSSDNKSKILGIKNNVFDILIKIITSGENLSIQVHPNDNYAKLNEEDKGKTEVWYILNAEEGSTIVLGLSKSYEMFLENLKYNEIQKSLRYEEVKKGDFIIIKPGTIHGIGKGVTLLEIQNESDITYRLYDYGRKRELQIEKALDVIDSKEVPKIVNYANLNDDKYYKMLIYNSKDFKLELYNIRKKIRVNNYKKTYSILTIIEGEGYIKHKRGFVKLNLLDSVLIPATLSEYEIIGKIKFLKTYN